MNILRRRSRIWLGLLALGCGSGADGASPAAPVSAEASGPSAASADEPAPRTALDNGTPAPPPQAPTTVTTGAAEQSAVPTPLPAPAAHTPCTPPPGVSGSPSTIEEAVALMNALPKPTSLPCFLESLDRPLDVYFTSSELSLQPAAGARSPRTFIVVGDLEMSVVTNPEFIFRLELGYRSGPGRSIKGEVLFPLGQGVTAAMIESRIRIGDVSICGGCHGAETRPADPFFVDGAFESSIAVPLAFFEVDLESMRQESASCDAAQEADRCAQLSALFDHGEMRRSTLWDAR